MCSQTRAEVSAAWGGMTNRRKGERSGTGKGLNSGDRTASLVERSHVSGDFSLFLTLLMMTGCTWPQTQ